MKLSKKKYDEACKSFEIIESGKLIDIDDARKHYAIAMIGMMEAYFLSEGIPYENNPKSICEKYNIVYRKSTFYKDINVWPIVAVYKFSYKDGYKKDYAELDQNKVTRFNNCYKSLRLNALEAIKRNPVDKEVHIEKSLTVEDVMNKIIDDAGLPEDMKTFGDDSKKQQELNIANPKKKKEKSNFFKKVLKTFFIEVTINKKK